MEEWGSHISSSDSVNITVCPLGVELVTTERRDHRGWCFPCHFCGIFSRIFSTAPDQTQHWIFLWRTKQFGARNPVLCKWNTEVNDPKIATMRRIMLGSIFTDNWIERLDFDVSIPTLTGLWVASKWAKDSQKSTLSRRRRMRSEDNCSSKSSFLIHLNWKFKQRRISINKGSSWNLSLVSKSALNVLTRRWLFN